MKHDLNLVKRFLSDTTPFFKLVDLLGVILMAIAGILADQHILDLPHATLLGAIGGTLTGLAKLSVKSEAVLHGIQEPEELRTKLPDLIKDGGAIIRDIREASIEFKTSQADESTNK